MGDYEVSTVDTNSTTVTVPTNQYISNSCNMNARQGDQPYIQWSPQTRKPSEIYMNNIHRQSHQMEDVLSYKILNSNKKMGIQLHQEEHDNMDSVQLINTGQGKRVSPSGFIAKKAPSNNKFKKLILPLENKLSESLNCDINATTSVSSLTPLTAGPVDYESSLCQLTKPRASSLPTPISTVPLNSMTMSGGDKWSPQVENCFLNALRVIMKNGTSKIKLMDKNYGRNELISLYIKNRLGEFRTRKQISSHIQVWKKSIISKISNGIKTNDFEKELLHLIEYGAPQTSENWRIFEMTFNEIMHSEEYYASKTPTPMAVSVPSLPQTMGNHYPFAVRAPQQPQQQFYMNHHLPSYQPSQSRIAQAKNGYEIQKKITENVFLQHQNQGQQQYNQHHQSQQPDILGQSSNDILMNQRTSVTSNIANDQINQLKSSVHDTASKIPASINQYYYQQPYVVFSQQPYLAQAPVPYPTGVWAPKTHPAMTPPSFPFRLNEQNKQSNEYNG